MRCDAKPDTHSRAASNAVRLLHELPPPGDCRMPRDHDSTATNLHAIHHEPEITNVPPQAKVESEQRNKDTNANSQNKIWSHETRRYCVPPRSYERPRGQTRRYSVPLIRLQALIWSYERPQGQTRRYCVHFRLLLAMSLAFNNTQLRTAQIPVHQFPAIKQRYSCTTLTKPSLK